MYFALKLSLVFVVYGKQGVSLKNTLLVDLTPECALGNPPNNGIFPYNPPPPCTLPYVPNNYLLDYLWPYLFRLSESTDAVPEFVRKSPFGQPPIGPEDAIYRYAKDFVCDNADNPEDLSD